MSTVELLKNLKERNISIELLDGELDIIVNNETLSDELLTQITNNKEQILRLLNNNEEFKNHSDFSYKELKSKEYKKLILDNQIDNSNVDDIYNLTPMQEGFLFHSMMEKNSSVYFEQISIDLIGDVVIRLIEESWQQVVNRYDSLRTMFISDFRIPLQVVLKCRNLDFSYIDISEKVKSLDEIKRYDRKRTFNLRTDPLFRIKLIKRGESQYTLLISFHHIILDGWSLSLIISEFLEDYEKISNNDEISMVRSHKYSEYISMLNNRDKDIELEYWKIYLEGYEELTCIPEDSMIDYKGDQHQLNYSFSITEGQTDSLKTFADETGVTFNTIIQTIWGVVLSRYNGTDDVVFGSTVSGRSKEIRGIEQIVGLFINTIPVRIKVDKGRSFKEIAIKVQRNAVESTDYHHSSLAEIQIESGLGNALLDHILVFENYPIDKTLRGFNSSLFEIGNVESFEQINYDFGLSIFPGKSLGFSFSYNPEKYCKECLGRIASHIKKVITEILSNKKILIGDIEIIPEDEKNLLLNVFNDTKTDFPKEKTIVQLFEEQTDKTPDNVAVVFGDVELTYRELNEKANIVGSYLSESYEIKPDDFVGVILERSEKMVIALLGILKSGAAYIPIDPEYPTDRIQYMLEDSNPVIVLGERNYNKIIDINEILAGDKPLSNLYIDIKPDNLSYVIYTSGSTGKPKGTLIEHRNFINMSLDQINGFGIIESDRILQFASTSFDASLSEIFMALFSGSRLEIVGNDIKADINKLRNYIEDNNVTVATLPPAIIDTVEVDFISTLRVLITAGDISSQSNINYFAEELNYINAYGPTEASVCTTYYSINPERDNSLVPIGKPISNTSFYILDKSDNLSPIGIPGELCISGIGLARGYLNKPDLTNEKFVDNPFISGERMYRTGDIGRWLPDGNIDFLGRINNQVKIRGFRIELGEIENSLQQHNNISSTLVLAIENGKGEKQLVAYYVSEKELIIQELINLLGKSLPDYMIPSFFVHMKTFPLSPNGKIDRKALPDFKDGFKTSYDYVAPRNETEEKLVEIWEDILGVDPISVLENFFEIGGHSLKATRLVSKISKDLDIEIALKDIFSNPTIESLSVLIMESDKKKYKQIESVLVQESYELSNAQKRLWVLDKFEENNIVNNMSAAYVLKGELQTDAFKQAYSYILERHESLRTVFIEGEGEPRQKILENPDYNIDIIDLKNSGDPENEAMILVENELYRHLNLETGPLVCFSVIKIEDDKNLLLFNMHHIISDGWSMNILIREFLECYNSFKEGRSPDLKPLRIQYKDYSAWQNNLLGSSEIKSQKEYWLEKLSGELPVLELSSDKARPVSQSFNGNSMDFYLSKEIKIGLNNLCRENNVSLFMLFQALVKVLFHRYTGETDIILGSPVAGRIHEDLEDQIGFYINTLPFRDTITEDLSFIDILERIKKTCTDALDNQIYPFDRIVEELDIRRDLSHSPLFDVLLVLQNNESTAVEFDGLEISSYDSFNHVSKYDMTFNINEADDSLLIGIEFNTDIYLEDRIGRMGKHLKTLISSVLKKPDIKVKELEIIPVEEKNLLLNTFTDTKTDYPSDKTIVQMFEDQAQTTPDKIAVVYENVELTYRELNEKVNIVAHYLRDNYKIKPDELIGVFLARSEMMVIALLGIMKSGGAYVPIDPEYPEERIAYILEDSSPRAVICESSEAFLNTIDFININVVLQLNSSIENPERILEPNNLAYVIYTSGSSGNPKGTLIEHKSIVNTLNWRKEFYGEDNIVLQIASYSFDSSVEDIFTTLLNGSKLIIVNNDKKTDIQYLMSLIFRHQITSILLVPSMYRYFVNENPDFFKSLKNVVVAGESFSQVLLDDHFLHFPEVKLFNEYGPTENSVCTTVYQFAKNHALLIGKPISNTRIYILGNNQELLPQGVPGELCISGPGLARGYLNKPELTDEKFIDNPFSFGERMYRTGDLARWLSDGNLEFLGRIDNQVKIRGFRIELEEIENILQSHMDINISVVIADETSEISRQLVAYYVSDKELQISGLRSFLGRKLPDYMIPSYFVHMDSLPLSPNGKIDRNALPELDGNIDTGVEYVAPRNETEEKLVDIWQEIMGIEKVGMYDNFFELGGHSLIATKIVSRIRKEFDVGILLKDIFENQTVETLSYVLANAKRSEFKPIEAVDENEFYILSNAQKRLWILDQFEEAGLAYNIPATFSLEGELEIDSFRQAYSYIINRHESLRTVFVLRNGEPRQKILKKPEFRIKIIDLMESSDPDNEAKDLANKDLNTTFNLELGPLVRIKILKLADKKYLMLFNMHHIISDGWSVNIFIKEFLIAYKSFRNNNEPDFKPLKIHYKDYSVWQKDVYSSPEMNNQREYWLNKLSGDLPVLNFPSDYVRPATQTFNGNSEDFFLSRDIHTDLKQLCLECNVTLFMMLQCLVKILFHRYTGQKDIIIGSPIAGRVHDDLKDQIGFYVNILAFRDIIVSDSSFIEILRGIKKTSTEAFDNQEYPFDQLLVDLNIKRDLSRSPIFDTMVVLQNNNDVNIEFDDLKLSPYKTKNSISQFDLTLTFNESLEGLNVNIEYNIDIYSNERVIRMIKHFKTLIQSVLTNPESKITNLKIIPEEEKNQIIKVFNDTKTSIPLNNTIVDVFEEQVEKTPDKIAVIFEDIKLTYRALNEKANIIANFLINKVELMADDKIALFLNRSERVIISIFGILKAGAAYVPIDLEYPQERIDYILKESNPKVLLYEQYTDIDSIENKIDISKILNHKELIENPYREITPTDLAYIIFTSGSTGKPKGVMIEHKSVVNLTSWLNREIDFKQNPNMMQMTNFCFDVSIEEIFSPLLNGGTIFMPQANIRLNKDAFTKFVNDHDINVVEFVPSLLKDCIIENKIMRSIRIILIGAERLQPALRDQVLDKNYKLINLYGPTETTVTSVFAHCNKEDDVIGKPISNTEIYIVDKQNNLVPIGIPGELIIAGEGLARGYLGDKELTDRKFLKSLFNNGIRMYKTGDLARWLSSGNIEFLGRIDNQVKIRGFRIELGEIENALNKIDGIELAVVLVKNGIDEEKNLVAYYVSKGDIEYTELRSFLMKTLPYYMIPSYFVFINSMPLTSNKKIDIEALLELEVKSSCNKYIAPGNIIEKKLVTIWQEVLGVNKVGINDNFFELGGHSLNATRILALLFKELNVNISLNSFFKYPIIKDLALFLKSTNTSCFAPIPATEKKSFYDVSYAQRRIWSICQANDVSLSYNMVGSYKFEDWKIDKDIIEKSIIALKCRHEILRTKFVIINGDLKQQVIPCEELDSKLDILEINDCVNSENTISELIENENNRLFSFEDGSLFRVKLIVTEGIGTQLIFAMHHIISDASSLDNIRKDLTELFNGRQLDPLKIQYKDYTSWHNKELEGQKLEKYENYWLGKFNKIIPRLDFISQKSRADISVSNGEFAIFDLQETDTCKLKELANLNESTLYMVLLSSVLVLLYHYSGDTDIVIGSPIAGRTHPDLEEQIGYYLNTLCLRFKFSKDNSFEEILNIVKKELLESIDHQNYPIDLLIEKLGIRKELNRNPVFDVMVNMVDISSEEQSYVFQDKVTFIEAKSKLDLVVYFYNYSSNIRIGFEYNKDLFSRKFISKMIKRFNVLLDFILLDNHKNILEISLNNEEESLVSF
ncbi:MAG: amino acid adenylation domain-containing protein [bacterium]|nr:amino acid adenylation domain-containing protein [bacterium]